MPTPRLSDEILQETVVKELGTKQEWSYGFDVKGTGDVDDLPEELQGADRVLTKLEVFEVSPVLKGAGVDTQTVVVKQKPEPIIEEKDNGPAVRELARFELFRSRRLGR